MGRSEEGGGVGDWSIFAVFILSQTNFFKAANKFLPFLFSSIEKKKLRANQAALRPASDYTVRWSNFHYITTAKSLEVSEEAFTPYGQVHQRYSVR